MSSSQPAEVCVTSKRSAEPALMFDPALFRAPAIPPSLDASMVEGLRRHLWRYSDQQSSKNTLARIEDPVWLAAWDEALSATAGAKVMLRGSELGLLALRALHHGASRALAVERFPLDERITAGIVHKHLLTRWHALHGAEIPGWSEAQRRESFEGDTSHIDVVSPEDERLQQEQCDWLVFSGIDHSLLGTGVVAAIRHHRAFGLGRNARILPAKARVFAMGIQWTYPGTEFSLQPMNELRWSVYPSALEYASECWRVLAAPTELGTIDLEHFAETLWDVQLPIVETGTLDAIVFWFELDLGTTRISNAPDGGLRCIKPAVQYTDPLEGMVRGEALRMRVHVKETRLYFETQPPTRQQRTHVLPPWYVPMLVDRTRNDAYRAALREALCADPKPVVLDIGAGCGLLSMMAAQAGAPRVVACESEPTICKVGERIVALNRLDASITFVNKDCRRLTVAEDLGERADLVVFELFDCSLIGEGVLHFLAYAREHLLTQHARYLPQAAKLRAMLIEYRLQRVWDIDVELLNPYRFTREFINVDAARLPYRALSEPFDVFAFDFSHASPSPEVRPLCIPTIAEGRAGAVLFWFDVQLDETCWLSNAPSAPKALHWKQGLQFLTEIAVQPNMQLSLMAKHDGSSLNFQWPPEVLVQQSSPSKIPRFDPRQIAAAEGLDQQTRALLELCARNAEEYAKVAELAMRFALDPAAHGLDPIIAQRFASMLFR